MMISAAMLAYNGATMGREQALSIHKEEECGEAS
jgi:hypothetical protein